MPNKLTDNEIKKALECCKNDDLDCQDCLLQGEYPNCNPVSLALDLINRQEAELERLQAKVNHYNYCYENFVNTPISRIKAKAYEEFVELSKTHKRIVDISDKFGYEVFAEVVTVDDLDNLYKGLVGDDNDIKR